MGLLDFGGFWYFAFNFCLLVLALGDFGCLGNFGFASYVSLMGW